MEKGPKKERTLKPSAVLLSILIHVGLFLLAGMLVVFTVVKKQEQKFDPPKTVERPKMKLKKPRVKVKKSSRPKSAPRIVTRAKQSSMPVIELPSMGGMGDGLGDGVGVEFGMMPDISEPTLFGGGQSIGNDFVGTFYDMKRDRQGRNIPFSKDTFRHVVKQFMVNDWKPSVWSKYYRSPNKLYASCFMIPPLPANRAPEAFGMTDCIACCWMVHYKGKLVYPEDITFRFRGHGDEIFAVRVGGKINLIACWPGSHAEGWFSSLWSTSESDSRRYVLGNNYAVIGDWITLKAGEPVDMEIIFGEINGAIFCSMLVVEVLGEEYPTNPYKLGPKLPMFKTEEPTLTMAEEIWERLDPGDASVTNGPVFRDYMIKPQPVARVVEERKDPEPVAADAVRLWTSREGKTFEAAFMTKVAGNVVLKTDRGKQREVPYARLSEEDQVYVDMAKPPEFNIDFSRKTRQVPIPDPGPYSSIGKIVMQLFEYTFGVKLEQMSTGNYNHPLTVEYFAIGDEVDGDNYILLDRQSDTFTPTDTKGRSHEFYGKPVRVDRMATRRSAPLRGQKYGGYLITVTDARGKIIQHKASSDFLFDIVEELRELPVTRHFNRDGQRVCPPRPTEQDRPDWMRAGSTP